ARTKGMVFFCADDSHATRICEPHRQAISYGFGESAQCRATGLELHDFAATFCVQRGDEKLGDATLSVPGKHNVSNALGVIALAAELGISFEKIATSLG